MLRHALSVTKLKAMLGLSGMAMLMLNTPAQAWLFKPKAASQPIVVSQSALNSPDQSATVVTSPNQVLLPQAQSVNQAAQTGIGNLSRHLAKAHLLFVVEQGVGKARTSRLMLASLDTGHAKVLTEIVGSIFNLSISKDGRSVVYTEQQQSFPRLWRLDIVTGRETLLSQQRANYFSGSLSPDQQQLVFAASLGDNPEIYLANADGSQVRQVTHHPAIDIAPQWLPDQQGLIFTSDRQGLYHPQIYRYDFERKQVKRLTQGNYFANPKVSPDGQWLSYIGKSSQGDVMRFVQHLQTATVIPFGATKLAESMTFSTTGQWGVYSQGDRIQIVDVTKLTPSNDVLSQGALNQPTTSLTAVDEAMHGGFSIGQLVPSMATNNATIREPQLIDH